MPLDAFLGGMLLALTVLAAWMHYHLLVRPRALVALFQDPDDAEWFTDTPGGLRALRLASACTVILLGFLTGLVWAFLITTA